MKEKYEELELAVVEFETKETILMSGTPGVDEGDGEDPFNLF